MGRKACFEDFYKKISEAFIGDDVSKDYDYLCNMFSYFEEALTSYRSSPLEVFLRKSVLTICSKVTGEHPCRSVISIKLQSNFIEIVLLHECSPVNLLHIFRRTPKEFFLKKNFFSIFSKEHLRTAASFFMNLLSKS